MSRYEVLIDRCFREGNNIGRLTLEPGHKDLDASILIARDISRGYCACVEINPCCLSMLRLILLIACCIIVPIHYLFYVFALLLSLHTLAYLQLTNARSSELLCIVNLVYFKVALHFLNDLNIYEAYSNYFSFHIMQRCSQIFRTCKLCAVIFYTSYTLL